MKKQITAFVGDQPTIEDEVSGFWSGREREIRSFIRIGDQGGGID